MNSDAASDSLNTGSPDELERRRAALDLSGWGLPFKLLQLRNPCFWVFCALIVWGLFQTIKQLTNVHLEFATVVASIVLLGIYGLILGFFFSKVDRYGSQPRKLLAAALAWGGVAAVFGLAVIANEAISGIYGKLFGTAFVMDWSAALSAPFVEETSKAAGFLLLLGLAPRKIRSVSNALLTGAFLGLGFEVMEDLIYTLNAAMGSSGSDQIQVAMQMFLLRSGTGFFSHALYTALFCSGLIYLIGTPALARNVRRGSFLMAAAVVAHAVWDGAGAIADGSALTSVVMFVIVVASAFVFVWVYRQGTVQDREWMHDVLRPEVTRGALTQEELDAAAGTWKQSRGYVRAPDGERHFRGRKRRRRIIRTARHMAREFGKSNGEESPEVIRVRKKISQLRPA